MCGALSVAHPRESWSAVRQRQLDSDFLSPLSQAHLVAGAGVCPLDVPPAKCAGAHKKLFNVSYLASELTAQNAGFSYLRGTCGGGTPFQGGIGFTRRCEDILVQSHFSSANITVRGWTFVLRGTTESTTASLGPGARSTRCHYYAL